MPKFTKPKFDPADAEPVGLPDADELAAPEPPAAPAAPNANPRVAAWFQPILSPTQYRLFEPFAVLLVIDAMVDGDRTMHINTLLRSVPSQAVAHALSVLKTLQFITFDGVTITLVRTPIDGLLGQVAQVRA